MKGTLLEFRVASVVRAGGGSKEVKSTEFSCAKAAKALKWATSICAVMRFGASFGACRELARIGAYTYCYPSELERGWTTRCICTDSGQLPVQPPGFGQNRMTTTFRCCSFSCDSTQDDGREYAHHRHLITVIDQKRLCGVGCGCRGRCTINAVLVARMQGAAAKGSGPSDGSYLLAAFQHRHQN